MSPAYTTMNESILLYTDDVLSDHYIGILKKDESSFNLKDLRYSKEVMSFAERYKKEIGEELSISYDV
jgi:hypothetical protein